MNSVIKTIGIDIDLQISSSTHVFSYLINKYNDNKPFNLNYSSVRLFLDVNGLI